MLLQDIVTMRCWFSCGRRRPRSTRWRSGWQSWRYSGFPRGLLEIASL